MPTERKLVEFHKAKTILMKPLAYSLIDSFFFQKDVAFSQKFYFVQDSFSQARTRGRGNENNPFFVFCFRGLRLHTRVPKTLDK